MIEVEEKNSEMMTYPMIPSLNEESGRPVTLAPQDLRAWKAGLVEELNRSAVRSRLAVGLAGVACIHLGGFVLGQAIFNPEVHRDLRHPVLWFVELVAVLVFLRETLGPTWFRSSTAMNLVAKLW